MMKKKKGQAYLYFVFIITSLTILAAAAFFVPMAIRINTEFYVSGEQIIRQANQSIQRVQDADARAAITESLTNAQLAQQNNIQINAAFFQYSWIGVIGITSLVMFIYSRRLVELNKGGFV